eukprot:ctg_989.g337
MTPQVRAAYRWCARCGTHVSTRFHNWYLHILKCDPYYYQNELAAFYGNKMAGAAPVLPPYGYAAHRRAARLGAGARARGEQCVALLGERAAAATRDAAGAGGSAGTSLSASPVGADADGGGRGAVPDGAARDIHCRGGWRATGSPAVTRGRRRWWCATGITQTTAHRGVRGATGSARKKVHERTASVGTGAVDGGDCPGAARVRDGVCHALRAATAGSATRGPPATTATYSGAADAAVAAATGVKCGLDARGKVLGCSVTRPDRVTVPRFAVPAPRAAPRAPRRFRCCTREATVSPSVTTPTVAALGGAAATGRLAHYRVAGVCAAPDEPLGVAHRDERAAGDHGAVAPRQNHRGAVPGRQRLGSAGTVGGHRVAGVVYRHVRRHAGWQPRRQRRAVVARPLTSSGRLQHPSRRRRQRHHRARAPAPPAPTHRLHPVRLAAAAICVFAAQWHARGSR